MFTSLFFDISKSVPQLMSGRVQDGIAGLADMDAAFPHLQAQRVAVEEFLKRYAMEDPESAEPFGSHQDEGNRSNILLPSMHQVWPQLAPCLRHTQPAVRLRSMILRDHYILHVIC